MYKMELGHDNSGYYVMVENNKLMFETEQTAITFMIELLKVTGRIGY